MGTPHRKRRKITLTESDYKVFALVTTLSEAARMYQRDPKTVSYAIDAGNIAAIRVGRSVLVSVPSLHRYWGSPVNPPIIG